MASLDVLFIRLLNDESFIRWLRGKADDEEKEKWDKWTRESPVHREVVEKSRKVLTMPFSIEETEPDKLAELIRLLEKI